MPCSGKSFLPVPTLNYEIGPIMRTGSYSNLERAPCTYMGNYPERLQTKPWHFASTKCTQCVDCLCARPRDEFWRPSNEHEDTNRFLLERLIRHEYKAKVCPIGSRFISAAKLAVARSFRVYCSVNKSKPIICIAELVRSVLRFTSHLESHKTPNLLHFSDH